MSEETFKVGSIKRTQQGFEGHLERHFQHPVEAVWRMLVEPANFAQWLAPGTLDPHQGGAVHIDFADSGTVIDSTVLAIDAPRLLEYSWSSGDEPQRPLRWELAAADGGAGTQLTLTVHIPANEDAAKACAGFEGHLEILAAALEGVPIKFPFEIFLQARSAYQAQLKA